MASSQNSFKSWIGDKDSMKPQSAKNKGRKFQQLIVEKILNYFEELTENDVVSRPMGSPGPDIMLSQAALELLPLTIEAKHRKSLNIKEMVQQAQNNRIDHTYPVGVFKPHRGKEEDIFAVMKLTDLLRLLKERNHENTKNNHMGHRDE